MTESSDNQLTADGVEETASTEIVRRMFADTIHNIGNVITVARLAVSELEQSNREKSEVLKAVLEEILPTLEQATGDGSIPPSFFAADGKGQECIGGIRELLQHQRGILVEQDETVTALNQKLNHISEVITLQQRLIAGVGRSEPIMVNRVLEDAMKMMSESAHRHDVAVEYKLQAQGMVCIDSSMCTQMLINLIKNAIEGMDLVTDREHRLILCTADTADGRVRCDVEDNGPGMPSEVVEQAFDLGFTTKGSRGYGRGVGLNYCRRTAERFGGSIEVSSTPDVGTRFSVYFPVASDEAM